MKPEMSAYEVTEKVLDAIKSEEFDTIILNFANCDMVGHTAVFDAAVKAVETVDECMGKVYEAVQEVNGTLIITADHGNADQMVDYETGMVKTSHTLNLVDCIYVANDAENVKLRKEGILSDIAPTVLDLMGIEIPADMTSKSLLA